jgi:hypothetical protein
MTVQPPIYGLVAEFDNPTDLVEAARHARAAGYSRMDGYSPFPVEELNEALGGHPTRLPYLVFLGGLVGAVGGFFMQYYALAYEYPLNIGGRPYFSWPSFIPITFELMVLCAALTAVLGMLALNGLPMPYHPLFNVDRFVHASRDGFFLCIEAADPQFDLEQTGQFLANLQPRHVTEVPR